MVRNYSIKDKSKHGDIFMWSTHLKLETQNQPD